MIKITEKLEHGAQADASLTLPYELRQKRRLRTRLDDGAEAGLFLPHGTTLHEGDLLRSETGTVIAVHAAEEAVTTLHSDDPCALARVCYHLGNRHVPLQIGEGWARYMRDHVLDEMVENLGLEIRHERVPFEPEPGAYRGHHHD